jgi:hypothetical protein
MSASLKSTSSLVPILVVALMITTTSAGVAGPAAASSSTQSSVSAFISCPATVSFASPSGAGSCPFGDFTGVYTGIAQTVGSAQDSVIYMASASGQVKVNYTLTDTTSGKVLLKWVGSGSMSGGTCTSPSVIVPNSSVPNSTSYVISTGARINSGDTLRVHLLWISLLGTGTPTFCSGAGSSTVISLGTTVVTGSSQPILTSELRAGSAHQTMLAGHPGVAETYVNTGSANFTTIVLGVLRDSGGRTIDVLASSITVAPNANVTAFLAFFKQYPSGSYTMTVYATTNQYVAVSLSATATVTV